MHDKRDERWNLMLCVQGERAEPGALNMRGYRLVAMASKQRPQLYGHEEPECADVPRVRDLNLRRREGGGTRDACPPRLSYLDEHFIRRSKKLSVQKRSKKEREMLARELLGNCLFLYIPTPELYALCVYGHAECLGHASC